MELPGLELRRGEMPRLKKIRQAENDATAAVDALLAVATV